MPKQRIEALISELHDLYGDDQPSEAQKRLLAEVERRIHPAGVPGEPDPVPLETLELLTEELSEEHPRSTAIFREILETLKNIGV
jgi:hypothetical protein